MTEEFLLKYGNSFLSFRSGSFTEIDRNLSSVSLSDQEINQIFDQSAAPEDVVSAGDTVLFVVPDGTRRSGAGQIINLAVRRLIAQGISPSDMAIVFATGIHRAVTPEEKDEILTPFIAQRIKTFCHDARNIAEIIDRGETSSGISVGLNRILFEYDKVIAIGAVTFHYFAGFTGGRKLICPGLAGSRTVNATHKLAFDFSVNRRAGGVLPGVLGGNPVNTTFMEVASTRPPDLLINTIVNELGEVQNVFAGDWIDSHKKACDFIAETRTVRIVEKRRRVIVSAGGAPYDVNLIQAHKALVNAANVCVEGGNILLVADCNDGLGRQDFLKWFAGENSAATAKMLAEKYQVNGQTAWSIRQISEKYKVSVITSLDKETAHKLGFQKVRSLNEFLERSNGDPGYIIPNGAQVMISF